MGVYSILVRYNNTWLRIKQNGHEKWLPMSDVWWWNALLCVGECVEGLNGKMKKHRAGIYKEIHSLVEAELDFQKEMGTTDT